MCHRSGRPLRFARLRDAAWIPQRKVRCHRPGHGVRDYRAALNMQRWPTASFGAISSGQSQECHLPRGAW